MQTHTETRHIMSNSEAKRIYDAELYIASQRSDPFCRARVYSHMRSGIASALKDGSDAYYTAEGNARDGFHNIKRP